jgi:hypothetical protein
LLTFYTRWSAHLPEDDEGDLVDLAGWKLTCAEPSGFNPKDQDHVFAVLSQRLCLDAVLSGAEAINLADRSVAQHMRLLTGFSAHGEIFYTHSPSEPILALGSAKLLYDHPDNLGLALETLASGLCSAGLVEKGTSGELAARTLLLIARDFSRSPQARWKHLLQPLPLLDLLGNLFGGNNWKGHNEEKFDQVFGNAYVNFTHWLVTRDPMPKAPNTCVEHRIVSYVNELIRKFRHLLANLWARGAALQCCFNQASIDFLIPLYIGPVDDTDRFNPSHLSVVAGQVKFKNAGDKKAGFAIRPIGIPRDRHQPLPYLALHLELGNDSNYWDTKSKIWSIPFEPEVTYPALVRQLDAATELMDDGTPRKSQGKINEIRQAMDSYNKYSVFIRGASPATYGILKTVGIENAFATLLKTTMPLPSNEDDEIQHMLPLNRLASESGYTEWMMEYGGEKDDQ